MCDFRRKGSKGDEGESILDLSGEWGVAYQNGDGVGVVYENLQRAFPELRGSVRPSWHCRAVRTERDLCTRSQETQQPCPSTVLGTKEGPGHSGHRREAQRSHGPWAMSP